MALGGIGGVVRWDLAPAGPGEGERLFAPIRNRGPAGVEWESRGVATLGRAVLLPDGPCETLAAGPWGRDGDIAVVADARLFNGGDLASALGLDRGGGADLDDLLRAGYRRWGAGVIERLDGEFALAIWDGRRRRLLLARDPFGARPLFYRSRRRRTWFASEPKQILVQPEVPVEPDALVVGEYLLGRFEELDRTFFRGVRRLRPGHLLVVDQGSGAPRPYWLPRPERAPVEADAGLERFRSGLRRAVRWRLAAGERAAAHLSGGLDSSSIVVTAASLARAGDGNARRLTAVSCRFPGLDCDEERYIEKVAAAVPFEHRFVEPLAVDPLAGLEEDLWRLDSPFADLQRGQFLALSETIDRCGARIVLTGLGGDELVLEESYLQDLAVAGRWPTLLAETARASRYTRDGFAYLLRDALRPVAPAGLRRLYRRLHRRQGWQAPAWAAPEFVDYFRSCPEPPVSPHARFPSRTQETVLRNVQHPELCWALEALECRAAERGYLPSHPLLDRSLVELVLAMPLAERIPRGRLKRLLRDGLRRELPPVVRERREKTVFNSLDRSLVAREWRRIRERVLTGGEWLSARFVSRRGAEALFERCRGAAGGDARLRQDLWRVATTELWLRQLGRYNRAAGHAPGKSIEQRAAAAASV